MKPAVKKTLAWSGIGVGTLLVLLVAFVSWLLFTTSGARWAAGVVTSRFAPQVSFASLEGTVAGGLTLQEFEFRGPPDAAQIHIARLSVRPTLAMLLARTLRIENARVQGLVVRLPLEPGPEEPGKPLWVEPPLDIVVDDFALADGRIVKGRDTLFTLKGLELAARWRRDELRIDHLRLLPGDIAGNLDAQGRIAPAGRLVLGDLDLRWSQVVLPASLAGRELHTRGAVHFAGTPEDYLLTGTLDAGPAREMTHVTLEVQGTATRADIRTLQLAQQAGNLAVDGRVEFQPVAWRLAVKARAFDPGELLAAWPGRLDLDAHTQGVLAAAGPRGSLSVGRLSGELRGREVAGEGELQFAAPSRLSGDLRLSSGKSSVTVRGNSSDGEEIDATVRLAVDSLADWLPDSGGSLNGDFRVRGRWPALQIAGAAEGRSLAFAGNRLARLHLKADLTSPLAPDGWVRARASDIDAAGFQFSSVTVNVSGNRARHRVVAGARGEQLDTSIEVTGGFGPDAGFDWRGRVARFFLDTPDLEPLRLRDPTLVTYVAGDFSIGRTCLVQEGAAACVEADMRKSGALRAVYSFEHVPLALANALAPDAMPGQLRGELQGQGRLRRETDGQWFGDATVSSASASLVLRDGLPASSALGQRTLLLYENLDLRAELRGLTATAQATAGLDQGGRLRATLAVKDLAAAAPAIDGRIEASLPTLAPFAAFVPAVGNFDGTVSAQLVVGGTLAAPEVTGNVDAQRLQADLGRLGIELRDGRVRGDALAGGGFKLAGSVASGKGHLELAGTLDERGAIDARVQGQNFQAADFPGASVTVTPDLRLTGNPKGYLLDGELTLPRAAINLQKLPQDKSPNASPDVVVIRNGREVQSASEAAAMPLSAVVTVKLGENIEITGFGLESTVSGQLEVRESPGAPTTGSGQLMVAGTYKAYGQDLTIKEGRLLFAGTPLDNPRLAIVAMREINDDLQTGLRIAGSAQRPIITVISDPDVGEADALSYLVTGRSLNEVGSASGSSQDTLASATRSLEGAGAGLVAKRIGQRLGLDEASVEENDMIGGSALTIGEYLSPRLYLSYGVGLFEPGEVIALRYKLSDDVGVRVQRGTEETRAGIEYRIEK